MINLEWLLADGRSVMAYDVQPAGQEDQPAEIPAGAVSVRVWIGTR